MINITRESAYTDSLRNYLVELDGIIIGKIANGQSESFEVKPGTHVLRLKIDWGGSNEVKFKISKNEIIRFRCASRMKGFRAWLVIVYAVFLSNRYIELERID